MQFFNGKDFKNRFTSQFHPTQRTASKFISFAAFTLRQDTKMQYGVRRHQKLLFIVKFTSMERFVGFETSILPIKVGD